jgi:hypothetical protein
MEYNFRKCTEQDAKGKRGGKKFRRCSATEWLPPNATHPAPTDDEITVFIDKFLRMNIWLKSIGKEQIAMLAPHLARDVRLAKLIRNHLRVCPTWRRLGKAAMKARGGIVRNVPVQMGNDQTRRKDKKAAPNVATC